MAFIHYRQLDAMDCGPTCIRMVAKHYGKTISLDRVRNLTGYSRNGVSLLDLSEASENIGFRTRGLILSLEDLKNNVTLPAILHWGQNHFVILVDIQKKGKKINLYKIADPASTILKLNEETFIEKWVSGKSTGGDPLGIALSIEPSESFSTNEEIDIKKYSLKKYLPRLSYEKKNIVIVALAFLIGSLFQLFLPLISQTIVDSGIAYKDLSLVVVLLIAQATLLLSRTALEFLRIRILVAISTRFTASLLSDFWIKITKLQISYFNKHQVGDILQRLNDVRKLESFFTGTALSTLFAFFNFLVYSIILLNYSGIIFAIFILGSILYFIWIRLFMSIRRRYNYRMFSLSAKENNTALQILQGIQELKLYNAEKIKRWEWENIQAKLFRANYDNITLNQIQQSGAILINEVKNIAITFIIAKMVIDGQLTLGAMVAVQLVVGQLASPVDLFVSFFQNLQDARISVERIADIHAEPEEDSNEILNTDVSPENLTEKSIYLENISFSYSSVNGTQVLSELNLCIPQGKTTAIVGASGSGKTTLLKLLLKFHEPTQGKITLSTGQDLSTVSGATWRKSCGAVLQDGFIFNDSVKNNISLGDSNPSTDDIIKACKLANIYEFVKNLPNGLNTKIGSEGIGLSQGQKQRILIARALYKNPDYFILDEATNALDTINEKEIVENLKNHLNGRTVIIVAHRLSTVKFADKIIVLDKGFIVEEGNHESLIERRGHYYSLIKNQLELGN